MDLALINRFSLPKLNLRAVAEPQHRWFSKKSRRVNAGFWSVEIPLPEITAKGYNSVPGAASAGLASPSSFGALKQTIRIK